MTVPRRAPVGSEPLAPPASEAAALEAMVVVPTYNEADNLLPLVGELLRRPGLHVLVVDDASTDGTGRIADELCQEEPRVAVIHRAGKLGLGTAYLAGFRRALELGAPRVVQMDCDFSHPPEDVARLLATLDPDDDGGAGDGADVAVGSRYVAGGRIVGWGPARLILSHGGNLYARLLLGFRIRDWTAGFKAFRREALEMLLEHDDWAEGYAFQVQTTFRCLAAGLRVREVPITFRDRARGESKMGNSIIREAMRAVWRLRFGRRRR